MTFLNATDRTVILYLERQSDHPRDEGEQVVRLAPGQESFTGWADFPPREFSPRMVWALDESGTVVFCHRYGQKEIHAAPRPVRVTAGTLDCDPPRSAP